MTREMEWATRPGQNVATRHNRFIITRPHGPYVVCEMGRLSNSSAFCLLVGEGSGGLCIKCF